MTEYDYSPEAFEAYMHKQYKIATWVDRTNKSPPCNPFTPATPAVHAAMALEEDDRRHRRKDSRDGSSRRDRERERRSDKDSHTSSRHPPSTSTSRPSRHRSSSSTTTPPRPDHHRSRSIPQPLQLAGPYANGYMSSSQLSSASPNHPSQQQQYQYQYPSKMSMNSPRDSKHSSQTSSSTRNPPHSAPLPRPLRSQTTPPNYGGYSMPQPHSAGAGGASGLYPTASNPYPNAPQLPHSYYPTPKQAPLIKRLFKSITGGNKGQGQGQHKPPTRKRSMSF